MTPKEHLEILTVGNASSRRACIILHGYGADAYDLEPLSQMIDPNGLACWYFPQAPLKVNLGLGMTGRGWFPIDVEAMYQSAMAGKPKSFADVLPEGLLDASLYIQRLLASLQSKHDQFLLGGFSQGAMVALDASLFGPLSPIGMFLWSGQLVAKERWEKGLKQRHDFSVFQSHGEADPILHFTFGEDLYKLLQRHCVETEFHSFRGAHEIPSYLIPQMQRFFQRVWIHEKLAP